MPMIDSKITLKVPEEKRNLLKAELGKAVAVLGKPESYLMVGIEDKYDLWLGGRKLEKGAYVSVSLYGNASSKDFSTMTGQICDVYSKLLGIPGDAVYVTYHPISDWGWNGENF